MTCLKNAELSLKNQSFFSETCSMSSLGSLQKPNYLKTFMKSFQERSINWSSSTAEDKLNENHFRLFGVFVLNRPVFVIKDIELVEKIMKENFDNFVDYPGSKFEAAFRDEIFQNSLSSLKNDEWREARQVLWVNKIFSVIQLFIKLFVPIET